MYPEEKYGAECPVFRPTLEEFRDFAGFIARIEPICGRAGVCRVVPPAGWFAHPTGYAGLDELTVHTPAQQVVSGRAGVYSVALVEKQTLPLRDFRAAALRRDELCANAAEAPPLPDAAAEEAAQDAIERRFWRGLNVTMEPAQYGADSVGSLFGGDDASGWNVDRLDTILRRHADVDVAGVSSSMLYVGMWQALFAWHVEDMNLFSINYIHFGRPKSWWFVPPEWGARFESVMASYFPEEAARCREYLRHKTSLISPTRLRKHGIPYTRVTQRAGEFVLTFPYAYHAGFNQGFNLAESANFASPTWLRGYGREARVCKCRPASVVIDLEWLAAVVLRAESSPSEAEQPLSGAAASAPSNEPASKNEQSSECAAEQAAGGATRFRCRCGQQCCYPSCHGADGLFECSSCGLWGHRACNKIPQTSTTFPAAAAAAAAVLPPLVCHGCAHPSAGAADVAAQRSEAQQERAALCAAVHAYLRRRFGVEHVREHEAALARRAAADQLRRQQRKVTAAAAAVAAAAARGGGRGKKGPAPDAFDEEERCAPQPRAEARCALCGLGEGAPTPAAGVSAGPMLRKPIVTAVGPAPLRKPTRSAWVHEACALHSAEVRTLVTAPATDESSAGAGAAERRQLLHVAAAIKRSRAMKCCACGAGGATVGCMVGKCKANYHYGCALAQPGVALAKGFGAFFCAEHEPVYELPGPTWGEVRVKARAVTAAAAGESEGPAAGAEAVRYVSSEFVAPMSAAKAAAAAKRALQSAAAGASGGGGRGGGLGGAARARCEKRLRSLLGRPLRRELGVGAGVLALWDDALLEGSVVATEEAHVRLRYRRSKGKTSVPEDEWLPAASARLWRPIDIAEAEAKALVWEADQTQLVGAAVQEVQDEQRRKGREAEEAGGGKLRAPGSGGKIMRVRVHALQKVFAHAEALKSRPTAVCKLCRPSPAAGAGDAHGEGGVRDAEDVPAPGFGVAAAGAAWAVWAAAAVGVASPAEEAHGGGGGGAIVTATPARPSAAAGDKRKLPGSGASSDGAGGDGGGGGGGGKLLRLGDGGEGQPVHAKIEID